MKIQTLNEHNCEPVISGKDLRYDLLVDGKVKVRVVQCHDKDHSELGNIRIELVEIDGQKFWPTKFEELPLKYNHESLEEAVFNHLS